MNQRYANICIDPYLSVTDSKYLLIFDISNLRDCSVSHLGASLAITSSPPIPFVRAVIHSVIGRRTSKDTGKLKDFFFYCS